MRKIACLLCCIAISGCAPDVYIKDGATQAEFNQDQGSCQMYVISGVAPVQPVYVPPTYTATTTGSATYTQIGNFGYANGTATTTVTPDYSGQAMSNLGAAIGTAIERREAMRACMASRGYTLQTGSNKAVPVAARAPAGPSVPQPTASDTAAYAAKMAAYADYNQCVSAHQSDPAVCHKP